MADVADKVLFELRKLAFAQPRNINDGQAEERQGHAQDDKEEIDAPAVRDIALNLGIVARHELAKPFVEGAGETPLVEVFDRPVHGSLIYSVVLEIHDAHVVLGGQVPKKLVDHRNQLVPQLALGVFADQKRRGLITREQHGQSLDKRLQLHFRDAAARK